MAVLVTRPEPDNRTTAARLHRLQYHVLLAPMLRFEALPFDLATQEFGGIIVTSANALRAAQPFPPALLPLPVFAVGSHTAEVARILGFRDVRSAQGDARALHDLVAKSATEAATEAGTSAAPLLYLSAETVSVDLAAQLSESGMAVVRKKVYRMQPVAGFPAPVVEAFGDGGVTAALHYSRRTAMAFIEVSRRAGLEVSALGVPQVCISAEVAQLLREAGAARAVAAEVPNEDALLAMLGRILPSP